MFSVPARGLGERNTEMVQRNHMEQPTAICVLKAGLHSVMRMTDFKYVFSTYLLIAVTETDSL